MITALVIGLVMAQAPPAPTPSPATAGSLTDLEVNDAIQAGLRGEVAPRDLYFDKRADVTAVAYSPRARIGLAARLARSEGKPFTAADVPAEWRAPVVWIAFRDERKGDSSASLNAPIIESCVSQNSGCVGSTVVKSLWLSHDPAKLLSPVTRTLPYRDVAIIVAFPVAAMKSGMLVIAQVKDDVVEGRHWIWSAHLLDGDIAAISKR